MSFCTQCGHENTDRAKFCSDCGNIIDAPQKAKEAQEVDSASLIDDSSPRSVYYQEETSEDLSPEGISNNYAWMIAALPLSYAALDIALSQTIEETAALIYSGIFSFVLNTILVIKDQRILDERNVRVSFFAGILFTPVYLFLRASRTNQGPAIPLTWIVTTFIYIGISYFAAATIGVTVSTERIETEIQSWGLEQVGGGTVTVDCPDTIQNAPGTEFICIGNANGETFSITVTVQNSAGDVVWVVD